MSYIAHLLATFPLLINSKGTKNGYKLLAFPENLSDTVIIYKVTSFNQETMAEPEDKISNKKLGRPKLKEARVPFTTSLITKNKGKLEVLSSVRGQRKADVLNEILTYYFEHVTNKKEKNLLDAL